MSRWRIGFLTALLTGGATPLWGQTTGSIMVGGSSAGRDVALDRGFLVAKGTTLPQGHGYVAALALTVGAAYGISDRLTAQVGTTLWTISEAPSLYGTARYGVVRSTGLSVAVGALGVVIIDNGGTAAGAWPYVTTTVGTDRIAVTGLVGVGSSSTVFETSFTGRLLLQGAVEVFVAPELEILVESLYLGKNTDPVGAIGLRAFLGRLAFELGAIHAFEPGEPDTAVLPWAGVSVRF
jgi:hypothetical protein